jgi:3-methyladenine DNA glycosylase AlkD
MPGRKTQSLAAIRAALGKHADPRRAAVARSFFKTGPGEYGEGDVFLGVRAPDMRRVAAAHRDITFSEIRDLLTSPVHEERVLALLVLVGKYSRANEKEKKRIFDFYLRHRKRVNNWDLVDLSAPHIVGGFLADRDRVILYDLAKSKNLWDRRIAILATLNFIRRGDFSATLEISKVLLSDKEDLIHKAVGWMLREVGKKDARAEEAFLRKHCRVMPRTMLRYAIERFPEPKRRRYLRGTV